MSTLDPVVLHSNFLVQKLTSEIDGSHSGSESASSGSKIDVEIIQEYELPGVGNLVIEGGLFTRQLDLHSDLDYIRITNVPENTSSVDLITAIGVSHDHFDVRDVNGSVASVKTRPNGHSAGQGAIDSISSGTYETTLGKLDVEVSPMGGRFNQRILSNAVRCSWANTQSMIEVRCRSEQVMNQCLEALETAQGDSGDLLKPVRPDSAAHNLHIFGRNGPTSSSFVRGLLGPDLNIKVGANLLQTDQERIQKRVDTIKGLFSNFGEFRWEEPESDAGSIQREVVITYCNPQHAILAALQLDHRQFDAFGTIDVRRITKIEYQIPYTYSGLMEHVYNAANGRVSQIGLPIQVSRSHKGLSSHLTIEADGNETLQELASLKAMVDNLLAGVVVVDERGHVLWNKELANSMYTDLAPGHNAYIEVDKENSCLRMYRGSDEDRVSAQRACRENVSKLPLPTRGFELKPGFGRNCGSQTEKEFRDRLSEEAQMSIEEFRFRRDPASESCQLEFKGSKELENCALGIAIDLKLRESRLLTPNTECPVCGLSQSNSHGEKFSLNCGHWYHKSCLKDCISDSLKTGSVKPVSCCGQPEPSDPEAWKCGTMWNINDIEILQELFTQDELVEFYKLSYRCQIRPEGVMLQFCPTEDCSGVYRITENDRIHICTACLKPICTACRVAFHSNQTCKQYQDGLNHTAVHM